MYNVKLSVQTCTVSENLLKVLIMTVIINTAMMIDRSFK